MKQITSTLKDLLCAGLYSTFLDLHFKCEEMEALRPLTSFRGVLWYRLSILFWRIATWLYYGSNMECDDARMYTHDEIPDEQLSPRALNARYGRDGE